MKIKKKYLFYEYGLITINYNSTYEKTRHHVLFFCLIIEQSLKHSQEFQLGLNYYILDI